MGTWLNGSIKSISVSNAMSEEKQKRTLDTLKLLSVCKNKKHAQDLLNVAPKRVVRLLF